ncbi:MAG TPA: amino acid ABC transporter substrate-binding protein [Myxococcales bacterium]|nr:amino acid ABC transporter substrate-binding protein [Myxococcales bacterium]
MTPTTSRMFAGALALLAVAGLSTAPAVAQGSGAGGTIKIGATLPLTGAEARIGGFYKEGYDYAFELQNKKGGVKVGDKTMKVELLLLDDTSTQATAVNLADRLINSDKVNFLLGTYATNLVEAQSAAAEQNQMLYVNGGGAASAIYKRGYKWVFGLLAPVELLADSVMKWIDEEQKAGKVPKPAKIALLWENTSHGKDFRKGVSDFAKKSGGGYQVLVDESFELNGKDFSALLGKVKAANVDLFLADAHLPDYITMQRQYITSGMCHKVQSYGARGSEKQAAEALGKKNVEYILSAVWWSPLLSHKNKLAKEFADGFKAKYGREPEWYQALGYETARALFTAIEQAGTLDKAKVREKLVAMKIPSILPGGELDFPSEFGQQSHAPFVVQQNQPDGSAPIIAPADSATGKGTAPNPSCAK